jgi:GT2 family glycosyltransferase
VAVSPSRYLLEWLEDQHWTLPERCHVQQNILPPAARETPSSGEALSVSELVFFGRLEPRKGVVLFCDALDRLAGMQPPGFSVSFLGKEGTIEGKPAAAWLAERARRWPFVWKIVSDLDHKGAQHYLKQSARLAVIPSLVENSPYTVLECLGAGLPFLAARVGGIPELVHPEDLEAATFPTRPRELAEALLRALREGVCAARPALSPEDTERAWLDWHAALPLPASPMNEGGESPSRGGEKPRVSVCLAHHERPALLAQAVASLEAQDYPNLEVVLVDDGSVSQEAKAFLAALEPRFAARGWRIVRQENRYLGAARNHAARVASGEWLLFMDDDNCARPHEVSTFVKAALASKADILTCLVDQFEGQGAPGPGQHPKARWLPLGGAAAVGALRNGFGDANALVRRECFMALGGFSEDYGLGHEDWEFFARAVLAGYRLELVPEPLFWYRVSPGSMLRSTQAHANYLRSLRPYMDAVPDALRDLMVFAQGLERRQEDAPPVSFESLKAEAEACWNSASWQLFAPLRNGLRRLKGLPPERMPELASAEEAARLLNAIRQSTAWDVTGPLRALRRLWKRGSQG